MYHSRIIIISPVVQKVVVDVFDGDKELMETVGEAVSVVTLDRGNGVSVVETL